jgi:hypothetical protein
MSAQEAAAALKKFPAIIVGSIGNATSRITSLEAAPHYALLGTWNHLRLGSVLTYQTQFETVKYINEDAKISVGWTVDDDAVYVPQIRSGNGALAA